MDSPKIILLILVLGVYPIQGLLLPGKCPSKPRTLNVTTEHGLYQYRILFSIPFSDAKYSGSLFTPIPMEQGICYGINHADEYFLITNVKSDFYNQFPVVKSYFVARGDTLALSSSVEMTLKNKEIHRCYPPIQENVRFWFRHPVAIFWNCQEVSTGHHDEAIIVAFARITVKPHEFKDYLPEIKALVLNYTGDQLMERIVWPDFNKMNESDCALLNKTSCPQKSTSNNYLILISIYTVVAATVLCCIFGKRLWKRYGPSSNRVHCVQQ